MPERSWPRRTLAAAAHVDGVGLFTAAPAHLSLLPAEASQGIVFRLDGGQALIPAHVRHAFSPDQIPGRNTCLRSGENSVLTVEHILSALTGMGITDAILELDGPEIPIGDGSALPFARAIQSAGVRELPGRIDPLVIREPHTLRSGDAEIAISPSDFSEYRYELDYGPASPIPAQSADIQIGPDVVEHYIASIAPARTFCLESEAHAMRRAGLFKHLSPREMLVIGERGPIDNALRFEDEPARHKLLDLIGDLALVGRPILGKVIAKKSGHALNRAMAADLLRLFA